MIFKIFPAFLLTLFLVSCSDSSNTNPLDTNNTKDNNITKVSLTDIDSDGLADKYEDLFGLVVGQKDASSAFLDPIHNKQWHLKNSYSNGEDINIQPVWEETIGEKNITISIVDTGVDANHSDLELDQNKSYRYSDNSNDPSPTSGQLYTNSSSNAHGTACAGIVAAKGWNTDGVRGVAPNISLVGLNVFSDPTDANFASALLKEGVDVSSNSWGGGNNNTLYDDATSLEAIKSGVENLRDGKGVVYVFASGNDSANANFQSILSSGYVVSVSSVDEYGKFESYSDYGANILISAPGGSRNIHSEPAIVTTDLSSLKYGMDVYKEHWVVDGNEDGDYTNTMNGTSASCPIISGVVGLMLSVNNELNYKEVQYILAKSARKNDINDSSWLINGAGIKVSNKYGFGVVDAAKAVQYSKGFKRIGEAKNSFGTATITSLPYSQEEVVYKIDITDELLVQNVLLNIKTDHDNCGKLKIVIESPSGMKSTMAYGDTVLFSNYDPWTFLSVQFLDENSLGVWKVYIEDMGTGNSISSLELSLEVRGYKS